MARIYNNQTSKELIAAGAIQTGRDIIPNQIAEKFIPTLECNPKLLWETNHIINGSGTSSTNIFTTPADRDYYLLGFSLSGCQDAVSVNTNYVFRVTINGAVTTIGSLASKNLQIFDGSITVMFRFPLKIDRSSLITIGGASMATAYNRVDGTAYGYIDYQSKN